MRLVPVAMPTAVATGEVVSRLPRGVHAPISTRSLAEPYEQPNAPTWHPALPTTTPAPLSSRNPMFRVCTSSQQAASQHLQGPLCSHRNLEMDSLFPSPNKLPAAIHSFYISAFLFFFFFLFHVGNEL